MKRLTLLSGGEKSMTALAFLFSVFLAKPCPFYILDEVEAALDDLNIDRFLDLLRHLLRARPIHRRHPPEADDGGGRLALRRLDGRRRNLEGHLAADARVKPRRERAGTARPLMSAPAARRPRRGVRRAAIVAAAWRVSGRICSSSTAPRRRPVRLPRRSPSVASGGSGGCGRTCARRGRRSPARSRRRCSRTSATRRGSASRRR